jgi:NAD(P)-dependent dehydrogenase (short-subunit alcohol dehydrogenase family)
MEAEITGLTA